MTYTQFVSTMNHIVASKGYVYVVENWRDWFTPDTLTDECVAYGMGLIEYCCNKMGMIVPRSLALYRNIKLPTIKCPESVEIMINMLGEHLREDYYNRGIPEFMEHNVLVMEVGNAI